MNIIVTIIASVGAIVVIASPFVMYYVAHRPANGEKHELEALDQQTAKAETLLSKHTPHLFHHNNKSHI